MRLAFIGLGKMGTAMVNRLIIAGHEVTIYNRTQSKMEPLTKLGAIPANSITEAIHLNDIVLTSLLDDKAVEEVSSELLKSAVPGLIHVSLATIQPDTAKKLEKKHQEYGCQYVSAAVLGVPKVAEKGMLTAFCSGDPTAIKKITLLLSSFSKDIISLGDEIHAANVMKIAMNYSLITAIELFSELYVFAEKSGLDTAIIQTAMHQIYGHPSFKLYIDKIHDRGFDEVNFSFAGGKKDVNLFQEAFNKLGVDPGIANLVRSRFDSKKAEEELQDKDWCAIYEVIRKDAGLT
ncbi:MAG: NAD(P)-dependent oxidoreductase [Legionellales bacterium]|nr:NAD(P)-dependent oxidoreductase [Legionellales bacterium]